MNCSNLVDILNICMPQLVVNDVLVSPVCCFNQNYFLCTEALTLNYMGSYSFVE